MKFNHLIWIILASILLVHPSVGHTQEAADNKITILHTSTGVRFGILGKKPTSPEPTLFIFADTIENTLRREDFSLVAQILAKKGYLAVSLDLPCHGMDVKQGEPADGLSCWRVRLERNDNFVEDFMPRISAVLDFLVKEGYTNPRKVAACGASRGGFIALQFAAHDPRVKCVFAFAPVTNLLALKEFAGVEENPGALRLVLSLALANVAEKLTDRSIWLTIGDYDLRVSTDDAIAFTRRLVELSIMENRPPKVELHVMTNVDHSVPTHGAEDSAAWLLKEMEK